MKTDTLTRDELAASLAAIKAECAREKQKRQEAERALAQEKAMHDETRRRYKQLKKRQKSFSEQYFKMEMQLKGAQCSLEAFRSGAKYTQLRKDYQSIIRKKDAEIRDVKRALADAERRIVRMRKEWGEVFEMVKKEQQSHTKACEEACDRMLHQVQQAEEEICSYRDKARKAARQKYAAEGERDRAIERNKALQRQLDSDYETSGVPSSAQEYGRKKKKIPNSRPKTNRHRGGQPGRAGVTLKPRTGEDIREVWLEVPEEISSSPDWYETEDEIVKQATDIVLQVISTNYRAKVWRNRKTGSRYHAEFPDGIQNPANYGRKLKALILYLTEFCNVSTDKVRELLRELSSQKLQVSEGFVASLCRQFQRRSRKEQREAYTQIQNSQYVHIDSTVYDIESERKCVTVCCSDKAAHYTYADKKGHLAAQGTPVGQCEFQHYLVHDDEATFFNYAEPDKHQLCWVHLLRKLKDSVKWEPERKWNHEMLDLLQSTIHLRNQNHGQLTDEQIGCFKSRYDALIVQGESEYEYEPPSIGYPQGRQTLNEMKKRRDAIINCLDKPWLPHQNNAAERLLRPIKRHTRAAVTNRSRTEAEAYCAFLTVTKSAELRGEPIFPLIEEVISRPLPRSKASIATQFGSEARQHKTDGSAA